MKKSLFVLCAAFIVLFFVGSAGAGLTGYYYNLPNTHPDMQRWITGVETGYVEGALTGDMPTLTTYGATRVLQWDWWDPKYLNFSRIDSDADLQSNFASSWFPTTDGLPGDPYHFAVHWTGSFYVSEDKVYTYQMGSDDDSWLFIDNNLVLDLGGVHALTSTSYSVTLAQGWHDIDIFFAERHTVQSGFYLNFFSDLVPTPVPEPTTMLLLGLGLLGLAGFKRNFLKP